MELYWRMQIRAKSTGDHSKLETRISVHINQESLEMDLKLREETLTLKGRDNRQQTREDSHQIPTGSWKKQQKETRMKPSAIYIISMFMFVLVTVYASFISHQMVEAQRAATTTSGEPFPGVSRDLSSFCAARPSLPIDLASMVVHVKKNVSFNYKLYLFSSDHVFQTGQVVPRDDFRIHAFPVKLKTLSEFWSPEVDTFRYSNSSLSSLEKVPSESFNLQQFFRPVPLLPAAKSPTSGERKPRGSDHNDKSSNQEKVSTRLPPPEDAHGDVLPGDPLPAGRGAHAEANVNRFIEFDRDDQVSLARKVVEARGPVHGRHRKSFSISGRQSEMDLVLPIGAFSSFHVNLTYLVRKDFDQPEPEIVRLQVSAQQFRVTELVLISSGQAGGSSYPQLEDYGFLQHRLVRDPNTRITAINQIYEDWITRNFYTIVYIQRRVSEPPEVRVSEADEELVTTIVSDRLVFRGTTSALLGAEQLDYQVTAAAFITERRGLHYYLEFLDNGKFYLCAVDWTKRPFKMIDSRRFPIKATRTQLDNEELLLCPPAVCYSAQPLDEIVAYGRLEPNNNSTSTGTGDADQHKLQVSGQSVGLAPRLHLRDWSWPLARAAGNMSKPSFRVKTDKDNAQGEVTGQRPLQTDKQKSSPMGKSIEEPKFAYNYLAAKRNDIKVKQDSYGYLLTGHEIDASYRVANELYLIQSNHLITINYTLANETVTSSQLLADEFLGLSSTLIDPITGAFYDRTSGQIYFFKGDRYTGYDYATRKPLDDFTLEPPSSLMLDPMDLSLEGSILPSSHQKTNGPPLVSTMPVVNLLGRQIEVDGVYHDQYTDLVFIFSGMKFYKIPADEFKNASFKGQKLPQMQCINEHFLSGCLFDRAFPNPCQSDDIIDDGHQHEHINQLAKPTAGQSNQTSGDLKLASVDQDDDLSHDLDLAVGENPATGSRDGLESSRPIIASPRQQQQAANGQNFYEQQQMKLRQIAAASGSRKPTGNLLNILNATSNSEEKLRLDPSSSTSTSRPTTDANGTNDQAPGEELKSPSSLLHSRFQEQVLVYLLITMIALTILVSIVLVLMLVNCTKSRSTFASSSTSNLLSGLTRSGAGGVHIATHGNSASSGVPVLAGSRYLSSNSNQDAEQLYQQQHRYLTQQLGSSQFNPLAKPLSLGNSKGRLATDDGKSFDISAL